MKQFYSWHTFEV